MEVNSALFVIALSVSLCSPLFFVVGVLFGKYLTIAAAIGAGKEEHEPGASIPGRT